MTIELVILGPAMVAFIALIVFGARVALAHQAVQVAANDAARAASIERTQGEAETASAAGAAASLHSQDLSCGGGHADVDTSGFGAELGETGTVRATVKCQVSMGALAMPGIPGSMDISASATSPIDAYRER